MEMKYVVPDMAQSFGTLEFAGESEPIFEKDKINAYAPLTIRVLAGCRQTSQNKQKSAV